MHLKRAWPAGIVAAFAVAIIFVGVAAPARADGAINCGAVKGNQVLAIKGVGSRSDCRLVARIALTRYDYKPVCGQWGTGAKPCLAGGWYCSIPAAGVQERQKTIAYCYKPKPGVRLRREEYAPSKYLGLIKIGWQGGGDAQIGRGRDRLRRLPCNTGAQTVSDLHGIGCQAAVKVDLAALGAIHPHLPECPGNAARRWHGWAISAHPPKGEPGHPAVGTKFRKGRKSFLVTGGGLC